MSFCVTEIYDKIGDVLYKQDDFVYSHKKEEDDFVYICMKTIKSKVDE